MSIFKNKIGYLLLILVVSVIGMFSGVVFACSDCEPSFSDSYYDYTPSFSDSYYDYTPSFSDSYYDYTPSFSDSYYDYTPSFSDSYYDYTPSFSDSSYNYTPSFSDSYYDYTPSFSDSSYNYTPSFSDSYYDYTPSFSDSYYDYTPSFSDSYYDYTPSFSDSYYDYTPSFSDSSYNYTPSFSDSSYNYTPSFSDSSYNYTPSFSDSSYNYTPSFSDSSYNYTPQQNLQRLITQQQPRISTPSYSTPSYRAPITPAPRISTPIYIPTPTYTQPRPTPIPVPTPIPTPIPTPAPQVCSITIYASPTVITKGASTQIRWTATGNTSYVTLSGGNYNNTRVNISGSYNVSPYVTTTYTATCFTAQGQRNIATVTVVVNQPTTPIYIPTPTPTPCYTCNVQPTPVYYPTPTPVQPSCYTYNCYNNNNNYVTVNTNPTPVYYPQPNYNYGLTDYCSGCNNYTNYNNNYNDYCLTVSTNGSVPLKTTATIYGYVNPCEAYTSIWFDYGTSYGNLIWKTTKEATSYNGQFSASLTGLTCNTTYYYRAVAQNNYETKYGEVMSFRTSPCTKTTTSYNYTKTTTKTVASKPVVTKGLEGVDLGGNEDAKCVCDENQYISLNIQPLETGVVAGKLANFKITYKNVGTENLKNVIVRIVVPEEMSIYSADKGQFTKGSKTVLVSIPSLYTNESETFIVTVLVDSAISTGKQLMVNGYANYTVPTVVNKGVALNGEITSYVLTSSGTTNNTVVPGNTNTGNTNGNVTTTTDSNWYPTNVLEWFVAIVAFIAFLLVLRFIINSFKAPAAH